MIPSPVTVIVPTYNCGHLVADAVDSALTQTVRPESVVVVDDGSTDDTGSRLSSYASPVRVHRQPNLGVSAARNRGLLSATTEYVAFLDADDVWHPRKLELQLELLRSRPDLGILGTRTYSWPAPGAPALPPGPGAGRLVPVPWERLLVRNALCTSSVLVRRDVLDRVGGFDTGLQGPEDYDLWLRVAEVAPVGVLDLPLTGYREVPGSLSKQARRMEEGTLRIAAKLGERGAWRGRPWLRRKAYSMLYLQSAYVYGEAGAYAPALARSLRSLSCYPWPYRRGEYKTRFERPKWLLRSLLNLIAARLPAVGRG